MYHDVISFKPFFLLLLFTLALSSCHKDAVNAPCLVNRTGTLVVTNNLAVPVNVYIPAAVQPNIIDYTILIDSFSVLSGQTIKNVCQDGPRYLIYRKSAIDSTVKKFTLQECDSLAIQIP